MGTAQSTTKPTNNIPISTCASLFMDEKFADFHFAIESNGEKMLVPAHKILLAKGSPVFESMFYGGFNNENPIFITDTSFDEFKEFLQFFYLLEPELTFHNVPKVMELLDKYLLSGCMEICEKFLFQLFINCSLDDEARRINDLNDICSVHQLAFTYNLETLKHFCLEVMLKHLNDIINTDSFRQCSQDFLRYILDEDMMSYQPREMFNACINWAKFKCEDSKLEPNLVENLRKQLGDCLYYIQFGLLTYKQFLRCIAKYKGLLNHHELDEIFSIMSDDSVESKIFKRKPMKEWNNDEVLHMNNPRERLKILNRVNQVEILSFRTNQSLLLGAIGVPKIFSDNKYWWSVHGTMAIINRTPDDDEPSQESIIVLEQRIQLSECEEETHQIKLSKPIICHSGVLYEIQIIFDVDSWNGNKLSYYSMSFFELRYNDGIKVGIERISMVSELHFNLLFEPLDVK